MKAPTTDLTPIPAPHGTPACGVAPADEPWPAELAPTEQTRADVAAVYAALAAGKPVAPGIRDRLLERGRKMRDETYRRHGLLDIGVPAIRELRGELPDS